MANFVIFGPPGIGKSSLVRKLKDKLTPAYAIDLEGFPQRKRLEALQGSTNRVIGAADVSPDVLDPMKDISILLVMEQEAYDRRRAIRDSGCPEKADQDVHTINHWVCSYNWDYLLKVDDLDLAAFKLLEKYESTKSLGPVVTRLWLDRCCNTDTDEVFNRDFIPPYVGGWGKGPVKYFHYLELLTPKRCDSRD